MSFAFTGGEYNAAGSLNKFIKDNLNTTVPAWKSGAFAINYNFPDVPLAMPCFSVTHLGGFEAGATQGNLLDSANVGQWVRRLAEVSAWVDAKDNANWARDLMTMRDMVVKLFSANRQIPIYNVYGSTSSPTATGFILRIIGVEDAEAAPDPNPNVKRRRLLVTYEYGQR